MLHSCSDRTHWHKQALRADAAGWMEPKREQQKQKAVDTQGQDWHLQAGVPVLSRARELPPG